MNFLAHSHLSHNIPDVIIGNLCADAYKGSSYKTLPKTIQTGVVLHRKIDSFTDNHLATKSLKKLIDNELGRYAAVAIDVYFDHFLAVHWFKFNQINLSDFTKGIYAISLKYSNIMNIAALGFLEKLRMNKWIEQYGDQIKLNEIFIQMSNRFKVPILAASSYVLEKHYVAIEKSFLEFYPELFSTCAVELALD